MTVHRLECILVGHPQSKILREPTEPSIGTDLEMFSEVKNLLATHGYHLGWPEQSVRSNRANCAVRYVINIREGGRQDLLNRGQQVGTIEIDDDQMDNPILRYLYSR